MPLRPSPLSECPVPSVGWFGVNVQEEHRKERITLNHGDSSELLRMLVPFNLFFLLMTSLWLLLSSSRNRLSLGSGGPID